MEEIEVPEEYEDVQHQVPEELVSHQFGTHFLAVQGDDFSEPVDKKPKFSSPVVMRTSVVKCDKCHRNIKSEEFRSHYRDVHLESSSTDATKNQVHFTALFKFHFFRQRAIIVSHDFSFMLYREIKTARVVLIALEVSIINIFFLFKKSPSLL